MLARRTTQMNATQTGLLAGLILGAAGAIGGFSGFWIALAVGVVGLVVGRLLDGETDIRDLLGGKGQDR